MDARIGRFLHFMSAERGAADNTIAAYRNDLTQFHQYLSTVGVNGNPTDWRRIGKDAVVAYLQHLKERRYAAASVARKIAAVKSFFQYLEAEGAIQGNPAEGLQAPRVGKTLPKPLTLKQINDLLEQTTKRRTPEAQRDSAMIELLYATGLRVTELVSLDLESIILDPKSPLVHCLGKGFKDRSVPIHEHAFRALVAYLNNGRPKLVKTKPETALFVNSKGDRLTRQGFWLILKRYAKDAGLSGLVTPESLRQTFTTHMLRNGTPLRRVQEMLGHANISTTQVYMRITAEETRREYEAAHPRARRAASV